MAPQSRAWPVALLLLLLAVDTSGGGTPRRLPAATELPGTACGLGTPAAAAWALPGFLRLGEEYLVRALPSLDCPGCPVGLASTDVVLHLVAATPCRVDLEILVRGLLEIDGARSPGAVRCSVPWEGVDLGAGSPVVLQRALDCPCLGVQRAYALGFRVLSAACEGGGLPVLTTGDGDGPGTAWVGSQGVYRDAVEVYGLPGAFSIHAEAGCCDQEVAARRLGWGPWKARWGRP